MTPQSLYTEYNTLLELTDESSLFDKVKGELQSFINGLKQTRRHLPRLQTNSARTDYDIARFYATTPLRLVRMRYSLTCVVFV